MSVDPVAANAGAGFNRYSYAANNPYRFTDPDGRMIQGMDDWWRNSLGQGPMNKQCNGGHTCYGDGAKKTAPVKNSVKRDEYKGKKEDGEIKQSIKLVGPFDAYQAKTDSDAAKSIEAHSKLPGTRNGPADALRHCAWNCEMARSIGPEQAREVGDNHEAWGNQIKDETHMDLYNNGVGRDLGQRPGTCAVGCTNAVDSGALIVLPPERWNPSPP